MRHLTLDEKISLKGHLSKKGVGGHQLVSLTTSSACNLAWRLFGRPISTIFSPKAWRPHYGQPA